MTAADTAVAASKVINEKRGCIFGRFPDLWIQLLCSYRKKMR